MALLAQTAGPGRVGRVMSVIGVPMLLGPILGPVVGGLIVDSVSWRWIFYVNVPIAIVALILAAKLLKADAGRADAGKLDWVGLLLLSPGLALFVFGLSESESHGGFTHPLVWGPIIAGVVLVVAFVLHSLRATRPLIDVRLFRVRTFSAAAATTFLVGGALFGAMIILPLYYQVARGEDALTAGLLMAPQGLGAALAMPLAGRLTDRVGGGLVALVGLTILTLGTIPFAFIDSSSSYTLLAFLLVLRGLGIGGSMMPAMAAAYATLERADVPRATSSLNALQRIGGSIGTAVLAVVLQGQIKDQLASAQVGESAPAASGTLERLPEDLRQRLAEPLAAAFAATFWWAVGISVLALIPATILALAQRQDHRAAEVEPEPESVPV
jgi:EmrB/QacA subfamily drug resistance transporter